MSESVFINLLFNVGLLILVAAALTKIPVVRRMLVEGKHSIGTQAALALIFALISIFSTYTGIRTHGAIVNTRVIGVLAAGLLCGPYVGLGASVLAGLHRYLFDIGGFTALSCAISTLAGGFIGAYFSPYVKRNNYNNIGIFFITCFAEICQMTIILLLSRPFSEALALVRIIALPMITLNALGMVFFIGTFHVVFLEENHQYAAKMQLALHIADQSLPNLKKGLYSKEHIQKTVQIIYESLLCVGVIISDTRQILAWKYNPKTESVLTCADFSQLISLLNKNPQPTQMDESEGLYLMPKNYILTAAPLLKMEEPIGFLIIISRKQWNGSDINSAFVAELATLFSTQLELGNLEHQKLLRRKAELQALQSQVNPHFLYNALNTISYVCRENADRARALLLTLSTYYRQTLEDERYVLNLHTEMHHVNNYLELEKARFEEKLIVDISIPDDLNCVVPAFILQPLVENAIRYGADQKGLRHVKIAAHDEEEMVRILVSDHGPGIPDEIIRQLYAKEEQYKHFGLSNVHKRLQGIYGKHCGLIIDNTPQGVTITFLIPKNHIYELPNYNQETNDEYSSN